MLCVFKILLVVAFDVLEFLMFVLHHFVFSFVVSAIRRLEKSARGMMCRAHCHRGPHWTDTQTELCDVMCVNKMAFDFGGAV